MSRPDEYLAIPVPYGDWLGGLRWAGNWEAVETPLGPIGLTFAMAGEVARLLEGLHAGGRPLHFAYVLHLLRLLGWWEHVSDPESTIDFRVERLVEHYDTSGRPLRNAGVMFATICRDVPRVVGPVDLVEVCGFLDNPPSDPGAARGPSTSSVLPSLEPWEFETRVLQALGRLSDEELRHWLKFGRPPLGEDGEALAREALAALPRTLAEMLTLVERRPRLAGVGPMVRHLSGALTLPSRRLAPSGPPTGGYADITTRGQFEQILPAQLALDPTEFLRRFAEGELLHFHREEPKTKDDEELLLVIDQGVRTWGEVRLMLAAAALAFGRQAVRRRIGLRLTTTAEGSQIEDAAALGHEELGSRLEASDLSPSPALALERALEDRPERLRDVVLLTHPRSLAGEDVSAAARRARPGVRVFGVAVAPEGQVELAELRHGHPVPIAHCRVRIGPIPEPVDDSPKRSPAGWRGDVEPIGFPFWLPPTHLPAGDRFDFDDSGDWLLLVAGKQGFLHLVGCGGSAYEMLPRPQFDGQPLTEIERVLGVVGGFVVVCRVRGSYLVAHYDLPSRTCTVHRLGPIPEARLRRASAAAHSHSPIWSYVRALHTLVVRASPLVDEAVYAIALGAAKDEAVYAAMDPDRPGTERARHAAPLGAELPPRRLNIVAKGSAPATEEGSAPALFVDARQGAIIVKSIGANWDTLVPTSDGKPILVGGKIVSALMSETTLGLLIDDPTRQRWLSLYRLPGLDPLGSYPVSEGNAVFSLSGEGLTFTLSREGHRVAVVQGNSGLAVYDVGSGPTPGVLVPCRSPFQCPEVVVDADAIAIRTKRASYVLTWHSGFEVEISLNVPGSDRAAKMETKGERTRTPFRYPGLDPDRFSSGCSAYGSTALVDILGQIVILDDRGELKAMFCIFQGKFAGWLPDGTRMGTPELIGGAPTPDAPARFGWALAAARAAHREARR